ncbi:RHS repeat-associated core domain-containing protein [Edaphobacter aggregans]|uniref:RHS repeat-associated core domain-containing protein n=1 Tax=Edaphobacter aggregans TaxID=570835 RepID=UPI00068FED7E|nr:RHS repeat-associated core domain-containing protein [Edaphobacter aggregans]
MSKQLAVCGILALSSLGMQFNSTVAFASGIEFAQNSAKVNDALSLPPLQAPAGMTALSGQVVDLKGRPVSDVKVEIDNIISVSDDTGRFLLQGVPTGPQMVMIDGRPASQPGRTYGQFMFRWIIPARSGTAVLPFTIWMPELDTEHAIQIPVPTTQEIVATTPRIPGLEVHIPAGIRIRDLEGKEVHSISITPIPPDRPPFPLPAGVTFPTYFTIQPDGATIEGTGQSLVHGLKLVFPNPDNLRAGQPVDYWSMDPKTGGWMIYGTGIVSADQQRITPSANTELYMLSCSPAGNPPGTPPPTYPTPGNGTYDGEPVDLSTGMFVSRSLDFFLPDVIPISFSRVYRPGDTATPSRSFGLSTTHSYNMFLYTNTDGSVDLILDDGERIHYTNDGAGGTHTGTPTPFYGSTLRSSDGGRFGSFAGSGAVVTLKDGTQFYFELDGASNQAQSDPSPTYHEFLTAIKDKFNNILTIERSWQNDQHIVQITSPNGRSLQFTYDPSHRITKVVDNIGRAVSYTYDSSSRLATVTDANGGITTYGYSRSTTDELLTIKNPRGITALTNVYDSNERVTKQTLGDGGTYQFSYSLDSNGKVTQTTVTNPLGSVRRVNFDGNGYTLSDTTAVGKPEQQVLTYTRQAVGEFISQVTDTLSRQTTFSYDSMGNLMSVTKLAGTQNPIQTSFTYEPRFNQLTSIIDPLNHTTAFGWDSAGALTTITDANQNQTTFTYNSVGQRLTSADPLNNTTQYSYKGGDLIKVQDPLGNTTSRFVDGVGRTISLSDPLGNSINYTYDNLDQVKSVTDPLGATTSFTYDGNSNLLTVTDARNGTTSYTYDNDDRLLTRKDALAHSESYVYDAGGNLTQHTDRKGQVTVFSYDSLNRRKFAGFGKTLQGKTTTYQSTINYTYDGGNRLITTVDSMAGTVSNSFDTLDQLNNQTTPLGAVSYTYDNAGRRSLMTVAGQPQVSYSFDAANRITQIAQGTATVSFSYDTANRRTLLTLPNGIAATYSYDGASRLTGISYALGSSNLGSINYGYDAAGHRTTASGSLAATSIPATVNSATYNAANQLTNWNGVSISYDANGNLVSDGIHSYSWNARDQLKSIDAGGAATFNYDGFGRRTTKTLTAISTTNFLYDGATPVQEISAGGLPTANLFTGEMDEYFTRTDSTGSMSYLSDSLGSTLALADATGVIRTQYTYEPFGATTQIGASTTNSFAFTGREDDTAGLYFYRARYYSPTFGRFISEDPLGFGGADVNLYAYVGSDPIDFVDPLGLRPLSDCEKRKLAPYIPKVDLDNADVHPGKVPWYFHFVSEDYEGITRGNDVYFRPGVYDPSTVEGIAKLGHELVHVGQYRNGMTWPAYAWASRRGYDPNNRYEKPAYDKQDEIENTMRKEKCGGCPKP